MSAQLVTGQDRDRIVAHLISAIVESPTFQRRMLSVGLSDRADEVAESLAASMLVKMEGWLEREGYGAGHDEGSFWRAWGEHGWSKSSGAQRAPGADWLSGLRVTRGDPPAEIAPQRGATTFSLEQMAAVVDAAVKAAVSKPSKTETIVDRADEKGKVTRTVLSTEHRVVEP